MEERVIDGGHYFGGPPPSRRFRPGIFILIAAVVVLWILIQWGASLLID